MPQEGTAKRNRPTRRQEIALFAPETDRDAWVDTLSDGEFGDVIGPSWAELTGCNADHLVPDHTFRVALIWMRSTFVSSVSALLSVIRRRHLVPEDFD